VDGGDHRVIGPVVWLAPWRPSGQHGFVSVCLCPSCSDSIERLRMLEAGREM
jgi:hypothetical protein